jgi:hypothetical protein
MLFMVIERYRAGNPGAVGERFRARGRMSPDDVLWRGSWLNETGSVCYQLMEAPDRDALVGWTMHWEDLVEFEIVPLSTSAEFWATRTDIVT